MKNSVSHLSPVANSQLIAWHNNHDVQAVKIEGVEYLYINGDRILLPRGSHNPVRIVINFCASGLNVKWLLNHVNPKA